MSFFLWKSFLSHVVIPENQAFPLAPTLEMRIIGFLFDQFFTDIIPLFIKTPPARKYAGCVFA